MGLDRDLPVNRGLEWVSALQLNRYSRYLFDSIFGRPQSFDDCTATWGGEGGEGSERNNFVPERECCSAKFARYTYSK